MPVGLCRNGDTTYIVVGTLLIAFVVVLTMVGHTINRLMADTLRLQIKRFLWPKA